jgi:hypothetical protein
MEENELRLARRKLSYKLGLGLVTTILIEVGALYYFFGTPISEIKRIRRMNEEWEQKVDCGYFRTNYPIPYHKPDTNIFDFDERGLNNK